MNEIPHTCRTNKKRLNLFNEISECSIKVSENERRSRKKHTITHSTDSEGIQTIANVIYFMKK